MTKNIPAFLDPSINKCITCGLSRTYDDPKNDEFFTNIGKLNEAGKINYKINRYIHEPVITIFCSAGLPQAMKIDEACQFHQLKLGYPPEHYSTIYSATLSRILAEETKRLTAKTNYLAKTAICIAIGLGLLQVIIGLLK
jgi:hypothetical protein